MNPSPVELVGAVLFAVAVIHTFMTKYFERLAHLQPAHAGMWHLLGEVEVVFGFWAFVLLGFLFFTGGAEAATHYLEGLNYTEPAFVFVIMVIAASRPVLELCRILAQGTARYLPLNDSMAFYFVCLSLLPLLGSFVTEPAAMTLAALLLRDSFYAKGISIRLRYTTLGVLFVNVSIGGTLTPFAAPPVLMVAGKWGWDIWFMFATFGWKAMVAVFVNAGIATLLYGVELKKLGRIKAEKPTVPVSLMLLHVGFLGGVVFFAHHPVMFMGIFLFFLGVAEAYKHYQDRLILREGLLVAFFLAGLVTLGAQQKWWLQDVLSGMSATTLYFGATALTAITDNAALTYLGSLVEGVSDTFKYSLVAGAVTGGGLTVIANAPNPAGYSILKGSFEHEEVSALGLFAAALIPTLVAIAAFRAI